MITSYKAYETFQTDKERKNRIVELKKEDLDIKFNTNAELGDEFQSVYVLEYTICRSKT
jgi:hypothetical protein